MFVYISCGCKLITIGEGVGLNEYYFPLIFDTWAIQKVVLFLIVIFN